MLAFLYDLGTNILANVLFWIALGAVVFLYGRIAQGKFLRFFGLNDRKRVVACLSNPWTPREGSRNETGYLVALHELWASESVNKLFGSTSFQVPDIVRGLVDSVYHTRGRGYSFHIVVGPSPTDQNIRSYRGSSESIFRSNLIVVGASERNRIRRHYLDAGLPIYRFAFEVLSQAAQAAHRSGSEEVYTERRGPDNSWLRELDSTSQNAIVEKVLDRENGIAVFFCLGDYGDTTWLATEYLVRNWHQLRRRFADNPFGQCLQFAVSRSPGEPYATKYSEPEIVAETHS